MEHISKLLPQVNQTTTSSIVKVEPKGLTLDESYFLKAEKEYTIKQYEEKNISDSNVGHKGAALARYHIGNALMIVYEMVGLKKENYPSATLAKKMSAYIQDTFPYISPNELVTAVEFGLQGKYINTNTDGKSIFDHYGVMDVKYVNTFLQLYVKFRYEKKISLAQKLTKEEDITRKEVAEQLAENDKAVKGLILKAFEDYVANPDEKVMWIRDTWFNWLVYIGLIEYDREKLNERFRDIKKARRYDQLSNEQLQHLVRVEKIYDVFKEQMAKEKPFEIFNRLCYINADTYSLFGIATK